MTMEMVRALLNSCGKDFEYLTFGDIIDVSINDFDGFTEGGLIQTRFYDVEKVGAVLITLKVNANSVDYDRNHTIYNFNGFKVVVGYVSDDI